MSDEWMAAWVLCTTAAISTTDHAESRPRLISWRTVDLPAHVVETQSKEYYEREKKGVEGDCASDTEYIIIHFVCCKKSAGYLVHYAYSTSP